MADHRIDIGLYLPAQPPLKDMRQIVFAARAMRLNSLMIYDHFFDFIPRSLWTTDHTWMAANLPSPHQYYDYRTLLGYLGPRAGNVRIGVGVTEAIRQHPVSIAQAAITLAHITKRAPILGLGAGERMNTEPFGLSLNRTVGRLEEALQIIRTCLSSDGTFDFQGKHFQLDGAAMDLPPPKGRTPEMWLAADGPRMLGLTGKYADGWYPTISDPGDYARKLAVVQQAARDASRDPGSITPSNILKVVVMPTEQEARALLESPLGKYSSLVAPASAFGALGAEHPFGPEFRGHIDIMPERYSEEQLQDAMQQVPFEVTAGLCAWGTPEQVTARLREFGAAGMRHVSLIMASALTSRKAATYSIRAIWKIRRSLRKAA